MFLHPQILDLQILSKPYINVNIIYSAFRWCIHLNFPKLTLVLCSMVTYTLYCQKYWHPSLEEKKALPNCANKDGNIIHVLKNSISSSVASVLKCMRWRYPYVQVIGVWWWVCGSFKVTPEVFSCFLQTSQVLPHWLNHHFSLILVLYTETLSCYNRKEFCPNCWYNIRFPRISLYASTLRFVLMNITKVLKPFIRRGANTFGNLVYEWNNP